MAPFEEYVTVKRYLDGLDDLPAEECNRRLGLLREFTDLVQRTPDQMVDELYDHVTMKYKKRKFYTEQINVFSGRSTGPEAMFRGNLIRSFFIANGLRIPPEKPSWMDDDNADA